MKMPFSIQNRRIHQFLAAICLCIASSAHADVIFEDDFSSSASLDNWTLLNVGLSTIEVIEGSQANMNGYLKARDEDPESAPGAMASFEPTGTGYLDVRMSGSKWAASGVINIHSENGEVFNLMLTTTNESIKLTIDSFGLVDDGTRENEVYADLFAPGEDVNFPNGRDIRIVWDKGLFNLYLIGRDGTVLYHHADKVTAIEGDLPNSIILAGGYDGAVARQGCFDYVVVKSGLPESGAGAPLQELLFEEDFASAASLDSWTLENMENSTVNIVEGVSGNMEGYLEVIDNDTVTYPIVRRDFGPTEIGFIDLRMSGTKWAGSGVMFLYSESGPLFNISLSTTNGAIETTINTFAVSPVREDKIFADPLNAELETAGFPLGRDFRVIWSDGMIKLLITGIDGVVYQHPEKAFTIEGGIPTAVAFSAGYDTATGRSGFVDFVQVYSGFPSAGDGTGVSTLPFLETFDAPDALDRFTITGSGDHSIEVLHSVENGMSGSLYLEDELLDTSPSAGLSFNAVPDGFLRVELTGSGPKQQNLVLGGENNEGYRIELETLDGKILVYANGDPNPIFKEAYAAGETVDTLAGRTLTLLWRGSGTADLYWETLGGETLYEPGLPALNTGAMGTLLISAGSDSEMGGRLWVDRLEIKAGTPPNGIGSVDHSLPYMADFSQSIDLEGWESEDSVYLLENNDGSLAGQLILADESMESVASVSREFTGNDYGAIELDFTATEGEQEIFRVNAGSDTLYTVSVILDATGYSLIVNGDTGSPIVSSFIDGEGLDNHQARELLVKWDGSQAEFSIAGSLVSAHALASGDPDGLELLAGTSDSTGMELLVHEVSIERSSRVWDDYVEAWSSGGDLPIANYANAGYNYGRSRIPEVHELGLKYFNVTDYGAVPDDEVSDHDAIKSAIAAATANDGGVVFFPPGEFLVNEMPGASTSQKIYIRESNIILKGSGSGEGGTTLFMREHLLPTDLSKPWSTPSLFTFEGNTSRGQFCGSTTESTRMGSYHLTLTTTSKLKVGDFIEFSHHKTDSDWVNQFLEGKQVRSDWTMIMDDGVLMREYNRVVAINGNTLELAAPIMGDYSPGISVFLKYFVNHVGIEDFQFKGNFHERFDHHGGDWNSATMTDKYGTEALYAAYMDGGWGGFTFNGVANSWCRRVRFTDTNTCVGFRFCSSTSILESTVDGNAGHSTFSFSYGSHNIVGNCQDVTPLGHLSGHHGPNMSNEECGSTNWRYSTLTAGALDFHASHPRANLIDAYTGWGFNSSGGNYANLPNSLDEVTFWNLTIEGPLTSTIDFWNLGPVYSGYPRIVNPNVVGFNSSGPAKFNMDNLGHAESLDGLVSPESLYEAQMELELGSVPSWMDTSIQQFEDLKKLYDGADPEGITTHDLNLSVSYGGSLLTDLENGQQPVFSVGRVDVQVDEGHVFLGWEGDLYHAQESMVVTMTQDLDAHAVIVADNSLRLAFNSWYEDLDGYAICKLGWLYYGSMQEPLWEWVYSYTQKTWIYYYLGEENLYFYYPDSGFDSWFYTNEELMPWYYRDSTVDAGWYYYDTATNAFHFGGVGGLPVLPI